MTAEKSVKTAPRRGARIPLRIAPMSHASCVERVWRRVWCPAPRRYINSPIVLVSTHRLKSSSSFSDLGKAFKSFSRHRLFYRTPRSEIFSCSEQKRNKTKVTMVFSAKSIVSALFGSALAQRAGQREETQESSIQGRRYKDLKLLALHYMPDFDERKYWTYGCNCLILGDRPMSDPGFGRPVDKLDGVCKAYKDCQKCVQMKFGEQCIGELVRYKWKKNQKGNIVCTNKPNTCERALCECDNKYTSELPAVRDVFDDKYHAFWGPWEYQDTNNCVRSPGISEPECCGADDGPMVLFNSLNKECCADKTVRPIGMCETF